MEPTRDETEPPVIRVLPSPSRRGDLLATTTFWLALVGIGTLLAGWVQLPGGTHGGEEKLRAQGFVLVGSLFAMLSVACSVPLLYRFQRSTWYSRLAILLALASFLLILLVPAV